MIPWVSSAMRATGRSAPRWGVRDHTYNKPVVPFETRVSRARDFHFVRDEPRSGGRTKYEGTLEGFRTYDTGDSPKSLTMTLGRGHADRTLVSPIPVPQLSPSCKLSCKLFIEVTGASGVFRKQQIVIRMNYFPSDPFVKQVSSLAPRLLPRVPFFPLVFLLFRQVPLAFYFDARHAP